MAELKLITPYIPLLMDSYDGLNSRRKFVSEFILTGNGFG